jgi:hypothetical protein
MFREATLDERRDPEVPGAKLLARLLAAAVLAAACLGVAPAVLEWIDYVRWGGSVDVPPPGRWAFLLLLLCLLEIAYAVYLWQLADWMSLLVVATAALVLAGLYAIALGLTLVSRPTDGLIGEQGLQLGHHLAGGKAAMWSLLMLGVWMLLALFGARLSLAWRRAAQGENRRSP